MLGLFSNKFKSRRQSVVRTHPRRARLSLESLESRDCPTAAPTLSVVASYGTSDAVVLSGIVSDPQPGGVSVSFQGGVTGSVLTNADGTFSYSGVDNGSPTEAVATDAVGAVSNTISIAGSNWATSSGPVISNFQATQISGNAWTFTGQVLDPSPGGLIVDFGGLPSLQGAVATTAANGTFSITKTLQPSEAGLVTVVTTDSNDETSNVAIVLADAPTNIAFSVSADAQQTVALSGQVTGADPGGVAVVFSGAAAGRAVTNPDGTFSVDLQATGSSAIEALATDAWGVSSHQTSVPVPSSVAASVTSAEGGGSDSSASSAPVVANFQATHVTGQTWTFSGQVQDASPSGLTVHLGGLPSLIGVTATTSANGTFSVTETLGAHEDGLASAVTTDSAGQTSNVVTALTDAPSNLSLSISYGAQRIVILTGQVTGADPGGMTVCFSGSATGSTVTNPDGSFSVELQATSLGVIDAVATDAWGVNSNQASVTVSCAAPVIENFAGELGRNNAWTFSGTVNAPSAPGMVVSFSGLPSITGQTTTVELNDAFSLYVQLQPTETGTVEAIVTDWWGQVSDPDFYFVPAA